MRTFVQRRKIIAVLRVVSSELLRIGGGLLRNRGLLLPVPFVLFAVIVRRGRARQRCVFLSDSRRVELSARFVQSRFSAFQLIFFVF